MGIKFYDSNGKYWGEYDETRNLFIPFKKRTMRDCYNCKRYEAEGECIECHYEPKDEPTISKMEQVEPQTNCGDFANRLAYERGVKHAWEVAQKVFGSTVTFYEAEAVAKQIDKDINVRSKDEPQMIIMVKDHGRKQALEMINLYHELKTEPQTERGSE